MPPKHDYQPIKTRPIKIKCADLKDLGKMVLVKKAMAKTEEMMYDIVSKELSKAFNESNATMREFFLNAPKA